MEVGDAKDASGNSSSTGLYGLGTSISGTLTWSPENAILTGPDEYAYGYTYEFNIGGDIATNGPVVAFLGSGAFLYDTQPATWTGTGFLDQLQFSRPGMTALDSDLSGIWDTAGTVFLQPDQAPYGLVEEWEGVFTMTAVPEPGTSALFTMAIPMLFLLRRRRSSDRV